MVPENIRKVPRPINTVVVDSGHVGPRRYAVRSRAQIIYKKGQNPQPRNGKVVGHIIDGRFVMVSKKIANTGPESLSYGASALVYSEVKDIFSDLLDSFAINDASKLLVLAILKVLKPHIPNSRMRSLYDRTFISVYLPGVALSENTISKLLTAVGMDGKKRRAFYKLRMLNVAKSHHIAIDGSLIQDTSNVYDLSAFSRRSRVKGCKDISLLYAYDIEKNEPICADVFPGNSIDAISYREFINRNELSHGIIIDDKGFPPEKIYEYLKTKPDLHYITPIKRNDLRINKYQMTEYDNALEGVEKSVVCKKVKMFDGRYLYAFKDVRKASIEESAYLANVSTSHSFNKKEYDKKKHSFGTIVFESDLDLPLKTVYLCYEDRWKLELVFRHYKNDLGFDTTSVQGDFAVIGESFVNFLSTIITCRLLERFRKAGLLDKMSYGDIMDDLSSAWRIVDDKANDKPSRDDGKWVHTINVVHDMLEKLELSEPSEELSMDREPKKRGRKPKNKNKEGEIQLKRPRGRPRKTFNEQA